MQSVPWHELTQEEKEEKREKARIRALQNKSSSRLSSSITRSSLLSLIEDEVCIYMYMYVYGCIWMYMYVYVCICMYVLADYLEREMVFSLKCCPSIRSSVYD